MTREEEKREAARKYATHDVDTDETDFYGKYVKKEDFVLPEYNAFLEGCKWSDENSKSPWISVKDDLPCNHKELLVNDTLTKSVIIRNSDGNIEFSLMYLDVEWKWMSGDNPTHWFPIPEPPKK